MAETKKILLVAILLIGTFVFIITGINKEIKVAVVPSGPSSLYTQGNKIMSSRAHQPVTLKGVVSDYFRYRMNGDYPALYGGLKSELEKIDQLKQAGVDVNLVGLYLAGLDRIKSDIDELDSYINYTRENNIYIYLAPTGNAFLETTPPRYANEKEYLKEVKLNDLNELTELLAMRYGNYPNVIFYLTAEPDLSYSVWENKQKELAQIVRKYTDNPIIVTTPYYTPYSSLPVLDYENVIYSTGGYVSKNDGSFVERQLDEILWTLAGKESLIRNYPTIVTEFGGNYGGDFSSARDLALFEDILDKIISAKLNYTVYRLSSGFVNDGLALFDTEGKLTSKGEIFVSSFKP